MMEVTNYTLKIEVFQRPNTGPPIFQPALPNIIIVPPNVTKHSYLLPPTKDPDQDDLVHEIKIERMESIKGVEITCEKPNILQFTIDPTFNSQGQVIEIEFTISD